LEDVTSDEPSTQGVIAAKLHKRALLAGAADTEHDEREQVAEQQEQLAQEQTNIADRLVSFADSAQAKVAPMTDKIASLPTTGGVGLLLAILVVILFTVVVVNASGDTRLKQFWYMLNGRATIIGRKKPTPNVSGGSSSSSGGTSNPPVYPGNPPGDPLPFPDPTLPFSYHSTTLV
jgi:hypothetical protein